MSIDYFYIIFESSYITRFILIFKYHGISDKNSIDQENCQRAVVC